MLEVCVDTPEGAQIAIDAGADRIELSTALDVGGLSPSTPLLRHTRKAISHPLVVLIRCRAGDFFHSPREYQLMLDEALIALHEGADGLVVGGLLRDHQHSPSPQPPIVRLHLDFLHAIAKLASPFPHTQLVVHRAFDAVSNPLQELEQLTQIGFHRILTSGGPPHAEAGIPQLRQLVDAAHHRIEILPAGGVLPHNASRILDGSHARQLHGSFKDQQTQAFPYPDPTKIKNVKQQLQAWLSLHPTPPSSESH